MSGYERMGPEWLPCRSWLLRKRTWHTKISMELKNARHWMFNHADSVFPFLFGVVLFLIFPHAFRNGSLGAFEFELRSKHGTWHRKIMIKLKNASSLNVQQGWFCFSNPFRSCYFSNSFCWIFSHSCRSFSLGALEFELRSNFGQFLSSSLEFSSLEFSSFSSDFTSFSDLTLVGSLFTKTRLLLLGLPDSWGFVDLRKEMFVKNIKESWKRRLE